MNHLRASWRWSLWLAAPLLRYQAVVRNGKRIIWEGQHFMLRSMAIDEAQRRVDILTREQENDA
jgi:hypothetical protein